MDQPRSEPSIRRPRGPTWIRDKFASTSTWPNGIWMVLEGFGLFSPSSRRSVGVSLFSFERENPPVSSSDQALILNERF